MKYLLLLALALSAGCGDHGHGAVDCAQETRDEAFVEGMEKAGANGTIKPRLTQNMVEVSGMYQAGAPKMGNNKLTVELRDNMGMTLDGATLQVRAFMPDHSHGTRPSVNNPGMPLGMGRYEVGPMDLWMAGLWELTVEATPAGGAMDSAKFAFCVE